jgi:hypothetical protein
MKKTKRSNQSQNKSRKRKYKRYLGGSLFNLSNTSETLSEINDLLKQKCPNLEIRLGIMKNMEGEINAYSKQKNSLLICLYYNNNCISSIQLSPLENEEIELRSFTNTNYENKKYNTLLMYFLIFIGNKILFKGKPITKVFSYAINPFTAKRIIQNFNILPLMEGSDFEEFVNNKKDQIKDDIYKLVEDFYKKYSKNVPIIFEIPLTNNDLITKSFDKINLLLGKIDPDNLMKQIKCPN